MSKAGIVLLLLGLTAGTQCDAPSQADDPLDNKLTLLWATPILKRQLVHSGQHPNPNHPLATTIREQFEVFKAAGNWTSRSSSSSRGLNEALFQHQRAEFDSTGQLWQPLRDSVVVQQLLKTIKGMTVQFLEATGGEARSADALRVFMWAGVHESCMGHMPHTHPSSAVSGTYYVSVPPRSGDLILEDPRGPRPPFDQRVIHRPRSGAVILFPSWLQHSVTPSCQVEAEPRIALSFNVLGDWTETADASTVVYALEDHGY
eukprot:TRINITY_DN28878_c0_g1_i4.p1 TRINITY_DN28878_c0_g1~~TRINITY_DN28878_c0_g1_i4.p1  ORF type:complete len:260 (-),score=47.11 TRINITY_DN28878_c0_g1_i4:199-978(-)